MKQAQIGTLVTCLLFTALVSGKTIIPINSGISDWSIEQAGETPYLIWNGMPYFGRFDSDHPKITLHGIWDFAVDSDEKFNKPPGEGWEPIAVPGVWNYLRPEMLDYLGVGWYRHKFHVDGDFNGDLIRLAFGGVNMRCRVWLNDTLLGDHEGAYTAFSFDVTKAIRLNAENTLVLRVDNRQTFTSLPPSNYEGSRMGWFEYGGIHRTVYLEAHPELTFFKLAVNTSPSGSNAWKVSVDALVVDNRKNPTPEDIKVEAFLFDAKNKDKAYVLDQTGAFKGGCPNVWGVTFERELKAPKLWSPSNPFGRYNVALILRKDGAAIEAVNTDFGFKRFEANSKGLFLNGKPYYIRGINRHEDDPVTGLVETPDVIARDIALIKGLNVNHMRPGHYPNDPLFFDQTDIHGIGITEEIPLYQAGMGVGKWVSDKYLRKQKPGKIHFWKVAPWQFRNDQLVNNAKLSLIEMIESDRNHPSLLAWSLGNENWTFSKESCETYTELGALAKLFDPQKPTTYAMLTELGPLNERCGDTVDFLSLNEYFGWYHGEVEEVSAYFDKMHKKYPDKPMIISEFGAGAVLDMSRVRSERQDGQGTFHPKDQARIIAKQYEIILTKPYIWGGMPWILADFRNGWFKEEHPLPFFNTKGILTHDRKPKPAYFALRDIYRDIEQNPPPWVQTR